MRSRTILIPSAAILSAFVLCLATLARAQTPANQQVTLATTAVAWDPNAKAQAPVPPPAAQWIAPDWKGPEQVLPDVSFHDTPLSAIARNLRERFKEGFDVIVPSSWESPPVGISGQVVSFSPDSVSVNLHVENVNAVEVFNAMNLAFEAENAPVRWQLQMNGDRPLAILRVLPALLPQLAEIANKPGSAEPAAPPPEKKRMVFFVGDLVGPGMDMERLYGTVCEVYDRGYGKPLFDNRPQREDIRFHKGAQLIIVNATPDVVDFIRNTLAALREKARRGAAAAESNAKSEAPKKPEAVPEPKP
jgi:hypothetical protein